LKTYTKPIFEITSFENDESIMKLSSANFNSTRNTSKNQITYNQLGLENN
jgi:hypothetical protein